MSKATGIPYEAASAAASAASAAVLKALQANGVARQDSVEFAASIVNFIMSSTDAYAEDDPGYDPDYEPDLDRADVPVADWREQDYPEYNGQEEDYG